VLGEDRRPAGVGIDALENCDHCVRPVQDAGKVVVDAVGAQAGQQHLGVQGCAAHTAVLIVMQPPSHSIYLGQSLPGVWSKAHSQFRCPHRQPNVAAA
jgi:hypothetical protein